MLNMVGIEPYDAKRADADEAAARMARLTGLGGEGSGSSGLASPRRPGSAAFAVRGCDPVVDFARLSVADLPDVVKARRPPEEKPESHRNPPLERQLTAAKRPPLPHFL